MGELAAIRVVPGGAREQIAQRRAVEVEPAQGAFGHPRQAQLLGGPQAGDAQLGDPARSLCAALGALHLGQPNAQPVRSAQPEPDAVDPGPHPHPPARDLDLSHDSAGVRVGHEVDVGHVAGTGELNVEAPAAGVERRVRQPRGARIAVKRGERAVLGKLRNRGREIGLHGADAAQHGNRLGRRAVAEWIEDHPVLRRGLAGGQGGSRVLDEARGDEGAAPVGVAHDQIGAAGGQRPELADRDVRRVAQHLPRRQGPERGRRRERVRGPVHDHLAGSRLHAHERSRRRQVVAAHLREGDRRPQLIRSRRRRAHGPVAATRPAEAGLFGENPGHVGRLGSRRRGRDRRPPG